MGGSARFMGISTFQLSLGTNAGTGREVDQTTSLSVGVEETLAKSVVEEESAAPQLSTDTVVVTVPSSAIREPLTKTIRSA